VVIVLLNSYGKRSRVADARRIRRWMETYEHVHGDTPSASPAAPASAAPAAT
jgi:hypothetical protein